MRVQVSQMSQETREALAQRIRSRLSHADNPATDHDVSIVGGGVAALTLALEIRRARPTTRILVIEPNAHPRPGLRAGRTCCLLRLADIVVAIDETPVGTYIELEGGEDAIAAAAQALGRAPADFVLDSYRSLFALLADTGSGIGCRRPRDGPRRGWTGAGRRQRRRPRSSARQ